MKYKVGACLKGTPVSREDFPCATRIILNQFVNKRISKLAREVGHLERPGNELLPKAWHWKGS